MNLKHEFYVSPEGETHVLTQSEDKLLRNSPKLIEELFDFFTNHFEEAMSYCLESANQLENCEDRAKLLATERFIRCNFSNRDLMPDVANGMVELEDVPCHLRGICKYENKICKPRCTSLRDCEERSVAEYCIKPDIDSAADKSCETSSSLRHKLVAIRKRFGFKTNAELVRFFRGLHLERRLAIY